jgi:hypothetical protein
MVWNRKKHLSRQKKEYIPEAAARHMQRAAYFVEMRHISQISNVSQMCARHRIANHRRIPAGRNLEKKDK